MRFAINDKQSHKDGIIRVTKEIDSYSKIEFPTLAPLVYDVDGVSTLPAKEIKKIEKLVRSSIENRNYLNYLKNEIDMTRCSFFSELDSSTSKNISLEIHHTPFTMFDICYIVALKMCLEKPTKSTYFNIANEVLELHYKNKVGLIPLSLTVHDLVHAGEIFIPLNKVYGNYVYFAKKYKGYIPALTMEAFKSQIRHTFKYMKDKSKPSILNREFTYIKADGFELPKKLKVKEEILIA